MTEGKGGPPPLKVRAVSMLGGGLLTSLMRTTRYERAGTEHYDLWLARQRPAIYVLWHGRLIPCSYYHRNHRLATLISRHRDGDYIAGVVERWGYQVVRGSSSRGGAAALLQMVRLLREGTSLAITPDGPRGPRQTMKTGPLYAAQRAGVPIIPVTAGSDSAWWFEGWDRFMVPRPFARIRMIYGEPLFVPAEADGAQIERLAQELGARLDRMTEEVDRAG